MKHQHQFSIIGNIIVFLLGCALVPKVDEVHSFTFPTTRRVPFARRRHQRSIRQRKGDDYYFSSYHSSSSSSSSTLLFLHVESLHPHRDSLVTLTDPIIVLPPEEGGEEEEGGGEDDKTNSREEGYSSSNNNVNNSNQVKENNNDQEKVDTHTKPFFADRRHRIAPIALGLYAFGHYLNTHTHNPIIIDSISSSTIDGGVVFGLPNGSSIDVDPIMLGGALIAIGLLTVTWTMDEIVHLVEQYMKDNKKAKTMSDRESV